MKQIPTLVQHIWHEQRHFPDSKGVFSELLSEIALAGKIISREVNKAGIAEICGLTGKINVQGEEVQKLDEFSQNIFEQIIGHSGHLCLMASEEKEEIIPIADGKALGDYVLVFDPIDGCSNINVNINIGTIFSIYKRVSSKGPGKLEDVLQPGNKQVAAGYLIYGSSTMLVYTTGQGVYGFTLDPGIGEFLLTHEKITLPDQCKNFSANETYFYQCPEGIRKYLDNLKKEGTMAGRYVGSLVADFHRNLLEGGIFLYPATTKNPTGKLRLVYECNPMAFIIEQAGGAASNGQQNILDIKPSALHQRTPLYIGNTSEVKKIQQLLNQ